MSTTLKVLVADDERVIADTLTTIFDQNGFEATAAYSGTEVVEVANIFQPDILLIDVVMHGMNGIEAAIHVREMLPSCKIVLLSGQAVAADLLDEAREQGHEFEILAKPLHPSRLIAYLRGDIALQDSAWKRGPGLSAKGSGVWRIPSHLPRRCMNYTENAWNSVSVCDIH